MKISGKQVLMSINGLEDAGRETEAWRIAFRISGRQDGRLITHRLQTLERAGLVRRAGPRIWRTTERGKELCEQLIAADPRQGGTFVPYSQFTDLQEMMAL